jgi:hypothetical protein
MVHSFVHSAMTSCRSCFQISVTVRELESLSELSALPALSGFPFSSFFSQTGKTPLQCFRAAFTLGQTVLQFLRGNFLLGIPSRPARHPFEFLNKRCKED